MVGVLVAVCVNVGSTVDKSLSGDKAVAGLVCTIPSPIQPDKKINGTRARMPIFLNIADFFAFGALSTLTPDILF
jgi:hypothetical protein